MSFPLVLILWFRPRTPRPQSTIGSTDSLCARLFWFFFSFSFSCSSLTVQIIRAFSISHLHYGPMFCTSLPALTSRAISALINLLNTSLLNTRKKLIPDCEMQGLSWFYLCLPLFSLSLSVHNDFSLCSSAKHTPLLFHAKFLHTSFSARNILALLITW